MCIFYGDFFSFRVHKLLPLNYYHFNEIVMIMILSFKLDSKVFGKIERNLLFGFCCDLKFK